MDDISIAFNFKSFTIISTRITALPRIEGFEYSIYSILEKDNVHIPFDPVSETIKNLK